MKSLALCIWMSFWVCCAILNAATPIGDPTPAWPQANGPFGNFNPRAYRVPLGDDLADAKQVWISDTNDLGFCKGSVSGFIGHLAHADRHPGTGSGLIVAEGKVFASSVRPVGAVWPENHVTIGPAVASVKWSTEQVAAIKRNSAYDANDLTVAIDLKTGKTIWTAIEKGRGINRYSGKRGHFMVTPAYHAGKIFSLGSTGILYAYDAKTGQKLWEDDRGSLAQQMPAIKKSLMAERKAMAGGAAMAVSLVVADGILIVPQFDAEGHNRDVPLRGVSIDTGKSLWEVPSATSRYATPAVWSHAGRQYILCATIGTSGKHDAASLRLIDPRDGRVCWTVTGLSPTYYSLTASDQHVLVNVPSKVLNPKKIKDKQSWGLMAAYRLSPEKAEPAWTMPDKPQFWFENHMDICAMRRVLVRDGRVYFYSQGHTLHADKSSFHFSILNEATGEPLYVSREGEFGHGSGGGIIGQAWLIEDRLFNIPDAAHSERSTMEWITTDPKQVRRLAPATKLPHINTTGYEVFIELPYVDGCFLMRDQSGHVLCYDLRK